ncbi:MAG: hypothetical protein Q9157_000196 [Trypethelium eluteriae]
MAVILCPSRMWKPLMIAIFIAILYPPLSLRYTVFGFGRGSGRTVNLHGHELKRIPDTLYVEDLHYHQASNLLFGASEADEETRKFWFPPTADLQKSRPIGQGTFVVIDPKTIRLALRNFSGPFITHGIDIWSSSSDRESIYIFAINHLPNPAHIASSSTEPAARSQIELFHYRIGDAYATHIRSIWHPLIRTPNDIYAVNSQEILVTNDHLHRSGILRLIENLGWDFTPWSNVVHMKFPLHLDLPQTSFGHNGPPNPSTNARAGVSASVALRSLQNMNGLGHGPSCSDVLIGRASAGVLVHAILNPAYPSELQVTESLQLDSTIDNPSYFADPYAVETGRDASGFVLAGLWNAAEFPTAEGRDPVVVWMVRAQTEDGQRMDEEARRWNRTVIFRDDGHSVSSASTALVVAIDPRDNEGRKQGWLFVTGPVSKAVVAARIDL